MLYHTVVETLAPAAARTADGQGEALEVREYLEAQILLEITAVAGAGPTLEAIIETSADRAAWFTHTSFPVKSSIGKDRLLLTNVGRYLRARWVIGGTSPSFTFAVTLVGKGLY